MTTTNKDFKVKNGLVVALGGSFGDAVTVGTPTEASHAATKEYVDQVSGTYIVPTYPEAPSNAADGQLYFDTTTQHVSIYSQDAGKWIVLATFADTEELRQHIHDTSDDGTGLVVTVFHDAGFYDTVPSSIADAYFYDTEYWDRVFDGGTAVDNFS